MNTLLFLYRAWRNRKRVREELTERYRLATEDQRLPASWNEYEHASTEDEAEDEQWNF